MRKNLRIFRIFPEICAVDFDRDFVLRFAGGRSGWFPIPLRVLAENFAELLKLFFPVFIGTLILGQDLKAFELAWLTQFLALLLLTRRYNCFIFHRENFNGFFLRLRFFFGFRRLLSFLLPSGLGEAGGVGLSERQVGRPFSRLLLNFFQKVFRNFAFFDIFIDDLIVLDQIVFVVRLVLLFEVV